MKRILSLVLLGLFVFAVACGGAAPEASTLPEAEEAPAVDLADDVLDDVADETHDDDDAADDMM